VATHDPRRGGGRAASLRTTAARAHTANRKCTMSPSCTT
jgi:hypothetical protein